PLRRLGEPSDIAAAALFLASDAGSFLTGKVIESDGGLIAPNFELAVADV
ncbi:SDR family oxidoreductase, partial [Streptomyces sp. SID10244]|nr:SDR family oxidoreductase [Streptomyces sp. SID10244]